MSDIEPKSLQTAKSWFTSLSRSQRKKVAAQLYNDLREYRMKTAGDGRSLSRRVVLSSERQVMDKSFVQQFERTLS